MSFKGQFKSRENLWVHAVSVGEILTISELINQLTATFPQYQIICSTVTTTGYALAQEKFKDKAIVIYAPLDWSWVVEKYIRLIKPRLYIAAETEIWPNLYRALKKSGVPIVIINGRISDKAFKGYQKFSFFVKRILRDVTVFCMQTESDSERVKKLGADSRRVRTLGNLKFDGTVAVTTLKLEDLGFDSKDCVLIGGSTHPGEEEILLELFQRLQPKFANLRLVIAPRHIERSFEIMKMIEAKGFEVKRFSQLWVRTHNSAKTIVVVDTIGHLRTLYSLATLVFVGKTLVGKGGQNMIEPASFGKAIIVGSHTENFKDVVRIFLEQKALVQVKTSDDFMTEVEDLLQNFERRQSLARAAKQVVEENKGATQRTMDVLRELL